MRPSLRGSILFRERRISQGSPFDLLKFRVLKPAVLRALGPGPTHIAGLETPENLTSVGRVLKKWYLDELPQLVNVVRGDILLIGTRPWPVELYEKHLASGMTYKRDMPGGLIGPVQSRKGDPDTDPVDLDLDYWEELRKASALRLLLIDVGIFARSIRVLLEHRGI